jgi:predicted MPP superfamily phosphohydrolase
MKLQYVSDLHVECLTTQETTQLAESITQAVPDASVIVLAGDIGNTSSDTLYTFLELLDKRYKHVLYVFGNHEYYSSSYFDYGINGYDKKQDLKNICSSYENIYVLDNNCIDIEGYIIGGTTLWFDTFHPYALLNTHRLNDYRYIPGGGAFLREEQLSAEVFFRQLLVGGTELNLLVTHHNVSPICHPKWKDDPLNVFYYTDMTEYLSYLQIPLVIHGHQHDNLDYSLGNSKVLMNARGYKRADIGFDVGKYVDIV